MKEWKILIQTFFCMPCLDFWCILALQWWRNMHLVIYTFFRNHEPNHVLEISLSYSQNMLIYFSSEKHRLLIRYFLEYCYIIAFAHNICASLKKMFGHEKCSQHFFIPEFDNNLHQAFLFFLLLVIHNLFNLNIFFKGNIISPQKMFF